MSEHWSLDGLHCVRCGADSNLSHISTCPNYGLYPDVGGPFPVLPKVQANITVIRDDLPEQHWNSKYPCYVCGATSNISHHHECRNYGLYDEFNNPIKVVAKQEELLYDTPRGTKKENIMTDPEESPILRYFAFGHLPTPLRTISGKFSAMAHEMETLLPRGPEKTVALRKLLESKDAAVRAALDDVV